MGMNERVIETLLAVGLGFLGSLVVMLIGNWLQAWREARRIADERRYKRAKDRVDKVEPYIAQLYHLSDKIRDSAEGVFRWVAYCSGVDPSKRPGMPHDLFDAVERALEEAKALQEQDPGIVLGSLESRVLEGVNALRTVFSALCLEAGFFLLEKDTAFARPDIAENVESWANKWHGRIVRAHDVFKGVYETLSIAIENLFERPYRRSWVQRLREWWGRR